MTFRQTLDGLELEKAAVLVLPPSSPQLLLRTEFQVFLKVFLCLHSTDLLPRRLIVEAEVVVPYLLRLMDHLLLRHMALHHPRLMVHLVLHMVPHQADLLIVLHLDSNMGHHHHQ